MLIFKTATTCKGHTFKYLDIPPQGWKKLKSTNTAPHGYAWYANGKSFFVASYKQALVKTIF